MCEPKLPVRRGAWVKAVGDGSSRPAAGAYCWPFPSVASAARASAASWVDVWPTKCSDWLDERDWRWSGAGAVAGSWLRRELMLLMVGIVEPASSTQRVRLRRERGSTRGGRAWLWLSDGGEERKVAVSCGTSASRHESQLCLAGGPCEGEMRGGGEQRGLIDGLHAFMHSMQRSTAIIQVRMYIVLLHSLRGHADNA